MEKFFLLHPIRCILSIFLWRHPVMGVRAQVLMIQINQCEQSVDHLQFAISYWCQFLVYVFIPNALITIDTIPIGMWVCGLTKKNFFVCVWGAGCVGVWGYKKTFYFLSIYIDTPYIPQVSIHLYLRGHSPSLRITIGVAQS